MNQYKQVGYNCLVIWHYELKNLEKVKKRITHFISAETIR